MSYFDAGEACELEQIPIKNFVAQKRDKKINII